MDEDFKNFLLGRGMGEVEVKKMENDKIGIDIVLEMADEDLGKYIKDYGDRVAVRAHAKRLLKPRMGAKRSLTEALQEIENEAEGLKDERKKQKGDDSSGPPKKRGRPKKEKPKKPSDGSKVSEVKKRKVWLGWIHSVGDKSKQIKGEQGGVHSKVVPVNYKKQDLIDVAKKIFFKENGESSQGNASLFNFNLGDFKENVLDDNADVQYYITKCGTRRTKLNFYLLTEYKDLEDMKQAVLDQRKLNLDFLNEISYENSTVEEDDANDCCSSTGQGTKDLGVMDDLEKIRAELESEKEADSERELKKTPVLENENQMETYDDKPETENDPVLLEFDKILDGSQAIPVESTSNQESRETPVLENENQMEIFDDKRDTEKDSNFLESSDILNAPQATPVVSASNQDPPVDTHTDMERTEVVDLTSSDEEVELELHRGRVFWQLMQFFENIEFIDYKLIRIVMINFLGKKESGLDGGGVFRDALSEFWGFFVNRCTFGTEERVPIIRHDFGGMQWMILARILVKGFQQANYFPVFITKPFIEACIFKKEIFDDEDLLAALFRIIGSASTEILKKALMNWEDFDDKDDLMEVLNELECTKEIKSGEHLKIILQEIAHRTIIQSGKFIIDIWQNVMCDMMTVDELTAIYEKSPPTVKNILRLVPLQDDFTKDQNRVATFLRKFIRDSTSDVRGKFLQFVTGANVVAVEKIQLIFMTPSEFQKRFISHTCGPALELPLTYNNYQDFRTDLETQLASNYLEIDIK